MSATLVTTQSALIAKIKTNNAILSKLGTTKEVREVEWNGTQFTFPNIRVRILEFIRDVPTQNCAIFDVTASIFVIADEASSLKINQIASDLHIMLDAKSFTQDSVKFMNIVIKQLGADWISEATVWKSELQMIFKVV